MFFSLSVASFQVALLKQQIDKPLGKGNKHKQLCYPLFRWITTLEKRTHVFFLINNI